MKNATPNGNSTDHLSNDQYSKSQSTRKAGLQKQQSGKCYIDEFDEQHVLRALQKGRALDQHNIVVCPDGHEHEIDMSAFIEKLREAGHNIVQYDEEWKGDCPILGEGRARNTRRMYFYIDTTRSVGND